MSEEELKENWNDKTKDEVYLKMSKEALVKTINNKRNAISYIKIQRDELQARINKAIEYIENHSLYDIEYDEDIYENETYMSGANDEIASRDLLDILKGSDKE